MPRLFCALKIPSALRLQLSEIKGGLSGARWIEPENYHITLRFFGDINRHIANDLALALSGIDRDAFDLEIDRLDAFGNAKPHSLYAHVMSEQSLLDLQSEIEWIAKRLGLQPDRRKFSPHITLARLRDTTPLEVAGFIAARGGFHSAKFEIGEIQLLSSKDSIGGGPYVTEARYALRTYEYGYL
ncbi:MAG: RNA 2',3'-cyclic phosphodiesterase [Salaquimonas sp.]